MRVIRAVAFALVVSISGGCALSPEQRAYQEQRRNHYLETRPRCYSQETCARVWAAAQAWVASNCGMKIQTVSDALIQTYNSIDSNTALQCSVVKEPIADNGYRLSITTRCANLFGCDTDPWGAAQRFNDSVQAAAPLSVVQPGKVALPAPPDGTTST